MKHGKNPTKCNMYKKDNIQKDDGIIQSPLNNIIRGERKKRMRGKYHDRRRKE
jgi:hypothetical protein